MNSFKNTIENIITHNIELIPYVNIQMFDTMSVGKSSIIDIYKKHKDDQLIMDILRMKYWYFLSYENDDLDLNWDDYDRIIDLNDNFLNSIILLEILNLKDYKDVNLDIAFYHNDPLVQDKIIQLQNLTNTDNIAHLYRLNLNDNKRKEIFYNYGIKNIEDNDFYKFTYLKILNYGDINN